MCFTVRFPFKGTLTFRFLNFCCFVSIASSFVLVLWARVIEVYKLGSDLESRRLKLLVRSDFFLLWALTRCSSEQIFADNMKYAVVILFSLRKQNNF